MTNETIIEKINEQVKRIIKETTTEYDKFKSYPMAKHMVNALWNAQRDKLKEINSNK